MNKKVIYTFTKQFIIPFMILGVVYMALIFFDVIDVYQGNFLMYVIVIIFTIIAMITFHEWSHLLTFLLYKVPVKAIFVLGFGVIFKPHVKIVYNIRLLKLFGGIVIPSSIPVTNELTYQRLKRGYQASLLVAPIITIVSPVVLSMISYVMHVEFSLTIFMLFIASYFTWVIIPSFLIEFKHLYGDIKAYQKIKHHHILFEVQLISQAMMQGNKEDDLCFLYDKFMHKWISLSYKEKKTEIMLPIVLKGIYQEYVVNPDLIQEVKLVLQKKHLLQDASILLDILFSSHQLGDPIIWHDTMMSLIKKEATDELNLYHAWLNQDHHNIKQLLLKKDENLLYFNYVKNEDTMHFWSCPNTLLQPIVCHI